MILKWTISRRSRGDILNGNSKSKFYVAMPMIRELLINFFKEELPYQLRLSEMGVMYLDQSLETEEQVIISGMDLVDEDDEIEAFATEPPGF